ncbi:MAG TPA: DUF4349 domain-containing protein [Dehalococcoidia bacterium]|nr:DUF4349 domain-containing protein [Dehalococcoidia bacterium]
MKRLLIALGLVVLLLVPVACAKAPSNNEGEIIAPTPSPAPMPAPTPPDYYKGDEGGALPSTQERMIVRNGYIELVVADVLGTRDDIAHLAASYGGYVVSSSIRGEEEDLRGNITIRVPDDLFEQALAEMRGMAVRVVEESTSSYDVTEEYVDLQSRLKNAEATEQQYLNILEQATDVEDILRVYERLTYVRQEIEQIKGRMQYLERTSSMSLIEVRLEPEASAKPLARAGWNALEVFKSAIRGLSIAGQVIGTIAIWLLIFIPIWGTILGIIIWRVRRRKRA